MELINEINNLNELNDLSEVNNQDLDIGTLNLEIESLDLTNVSVRGILDLSSFTNLKKLIINSNVKIIYPYNLKELICGNEFYMKLNNLPNGLTHLTLGEMFNHPIENLPNSIKYLKFGWGFNQEVDNLPENLEELVFCDDEIKPGHGNYSLPEFNQPINNLPNKLKKITLNPGFVQSIDLLPNSVEEIIFSNNIMFDLHKRESTKCVEELSARLFNCEIKKLPTNLKKILFSAEFNSKINWSDGDALLTKIEHVEFQNIKVSGDSYGPPYFYSYGKFNQLIDELPDTIKVLKIGSGFEQKINKLPTSLTELSIENFGFDLDNYPELPQEDFTSFTSFQYIIQFFKPKLEYAFNNKIKYSCKFNQIDITKLIIENEDDNTIEFICKYFYSIYDYLTYRQKSLGENDDTIDYIRKYMYGLDDYLSNK